MVAAFTTERYRPASRSAALRNTAARRSRLHADQSRHASRAAATAARTSVGPAWCTLARTWRWQWGITASVVFPVRTSLPPITSGISMGRADRSLRARLSSARSGVPGAWDRTGSLTGTGIFGMVFIDRNLTAVSAVRLRSHATPRPPRPYRARPPHGVGPRPLARVLSRRPGLRGDDSVRPGGGVPVGRRLPPPHRPQHLGMARRTAAAGGDDRAVPLRHPLPRSARPSGGGAARARARHPDRGRLGPRRQRSGVCARSGRQWRGALLRPSRKRMAADAGRRARHAYATPRRGGPSQRGRSEAGKRRVKGGGPLPPSPAASRAFTGLLPLPRSRTAVARRPVSRVASVRV